MKTMIWVFKLYMDVAFIDHAYFKNKQISRASDEKFI